MLTISTKGNFSWKWEMSGNELLMETSRNRHPDQTCWAVFCSVSVSLCAAAVYSAES